jgi:hypothetical protein
MPTQPQNVPNQPQGSSEEQLARAEVDPYYLWENLEPEDTVPYATVRAGLVRFITAQRRSQWDLVTEPKTPEHLARDAGLRAWATHEAEQRMTLHLLSAYSAADFHTLHFAEEIREGGNLNDPEWGPLIHYKLAVRDRVFFERIGLLMSQQGNWEHRAKMLFCMLWDRALIPLEFWCVPAATVFLREALVACSINIAGVTEYTVRQWIHRLGLKRAMPPVVLKYWNKKVMPRIDDDAARVHGLVIDREKV